MGHSLHARTLAIRSLVANALQQKKVNRISDLDEMAAKRLKSRVELHMEKHGCNLGEFSKLIGKAQSNVSSYLNGTAPLGEKALLAFCEVLHCSPTDIRPELMNWDVIAMLREAAEIMEQMLAADVDNALCERAGSLAQIINNWLINFGEIVGDPE